MNGSEVVFLAVLFLATYYLTDPTVKNKQPQKRRERGIALEHHLHRLRVLGANVDTIYDIAGELVRRGVPVDKIPVLGPQTNLPELQAKLQLMLEETPYVHRDTQEPGEDHILAKSSWQLWPRKLEQQNGDV